MVAGGEERGDGSDSDSTPSGKDEPSNRFRILKLAPKYFGLWAVLMLILASKLYLIRSSSNVDPAALAAFGVGMLAVSYLGAWIAWNLSGRKQQTGELVYLGLTTLFFLGRTILIYGEALAGR